MLKKKLILFGASSLGEQIYEILKLIKVYDVVAFADNDINKHGSTFCGLPVISIEEAISKDTRIVITSAHASEISDQLSNLGFNNFQSNIVFLTENIDSLSLQSTNYWEQRYKGGGNSGSGSYGRLAQFKADIINEFIGKQEIESIIELGCGDGNQLSLMRYPHYVGFDVSETAVRICMERFKEDNTKDFIFYKPDIFKCTSGIIKADITLSLDVLYHLLEENIFLEYIHNLFALSNKYVIIYSSNYNKIGHFHERHWQFTDWVNKNRPDFKLIEHIPNRYPYDCYDPENTSQSDFYIYERF